MQIIPRCLSSMRSFYFVVTRRYWRVLLLNSLFSVIPVTVDFYFIPTRIRRNSHSIGYEMIIFPYESFVAFSFAFDGACLTIRKYWSPLFFFWLYCFNVPFSTCTCLGHIQNTNKNLQSCVGYFFRNYKSPWYDVVNGVTIYSLNRWIAIRKLSTSATNWTISFLLKNKN